MKKLIFLCLMMAMSIGAFAQIVYDVEYLEKVGNGGTRVFCVTLPDNNEKDAKKLVSIANRAVIKAILFDGVENYNDGQPLVSDRMDTFANSIIDEDKKAYNTYCKLTEPESKDVKKGAHFFVEVNHYNLLRLLKMRGSLKSDFRE